MNHKHDSNLWKWQEVRQFGERHISFKTLHPLFTQTCQSYTCFWKKTLDLNWEHLRGRAYHASKTHIRNYHLCVVVLLFPQELNQLTVFSRCFTAIYICLGTHINKVRLCTCTHLFLVCCDWHARAHLAGYMPTAESSVHTYYIFSFYVPSIG